MALLCKTFFLWQNCKSFIYNSKGEPGHCPDEPEDSPDDQKEIPNLNGTEIEKEHWGFCDLADGGCNQRPSNLLPDQLMETGHPQMEKTFVEVYFFSDRTISIWKHIIEVELKNET